MMCQRVWLLMALVWGQLVGTAIAQGNSAAAVQDVLVSMTRGVEIHKKDATTNSPSSHCQFDGKLVFGMPSTLDQDAKFFAFGQIQTSVNQLMADYINEERCGIKMSSGNYAMELRYYDDHSTEEVVTEIAEMLVTSDDVDFIMAGYSSGLTKPFSEVTDGNGRMMVAAGASNPTIYSESPRSFGILPNGHLFHETGLQAFVEQGAKSLVVVIENTSASMAICGAVPEIAGALGYDILSTHVLEELPNATGMVPLVEEIALQDPDVVLTCFYECVDWVKALRMVNWSPKGHSSTACMGQERFGEGVGSDVEYFMGPSPWHPTVQAKDAITGWSSQEFVDRFVKESSHESISYHAACFATALSVVVQSIEQTDSTNETLLIQHMLTSSFNTSLGELAFDENGQNKIPPRLVQYDATGEIQTVYPAVVSSGPVLYPMPSWDERDCNHNSPCGAGQGSCDPSGKCICSDQAQISVGSGSTAACNQPEEMNYISTGLLVVGYTLFGVVVASAIVAAQWTWKNRELWIVKASQPALLGIIIAGCAISSLSLPFMGIQTGYREVTSTETGLSGGQELVTADFPCCESLLPEWANLIGETVCPGSGCCLVCASPSQQSDMENPEVSLVDSSCMVVPWLYGVGFAIAFSALFAKVERVRLISKAGKTKENTKIGLMHVIHIMAVMLAIEIAILTAWQIKSPLRWEREVLQEENGFPVESVGHCKSEEGGIFNLVLIFFHIACLFYALVLCFQTRHIDDDFAESNYIAQAVAFMFQVLTLAVPVLAIVEDSNHISYFVQVCTIFLQNFTVLALIFAPKMIKTAFGKGNEAEVATRKDTIPMSALTHSQWDEGVDLIHELMGDEAAPLTEEQQDKLVVIKSLLLKRNQKMNSREEKLSYIPSSLVNRKSKSNNFIMEQFGGVDMEDDYSSSSFSISAASHHSSNHFKSTRTGFQTESKEEGVHVVPPEFQRLLPDDRDKVAAMLSWSSLNKWDFDVFELAQLTDGNPLLFVGWAVLGSPHSQVAMAKACGQSPPIDAEGYRLVDDKSLNIPMSTLCNYLRVIEEDYQAANPYHNSTHAADVVQSLHSLIQMSRTTLAATKEELFSILLAAVVHDVKHPGRNNAFQSQGLTGFALTYNEASVLENLHVSHAFRRMLGVESSPDESRPTDIKKCPKDVNVLCNVKDKKFHAIRDKMIDAIMSTDMSKHFQCVANMKALALSQQQQMESDISESSHKDEAWQILLFMLHMADISGQAKPGKISLQWSDRVMEEFFQQGDEEAELGMPISALCNRATVNVPDSQFGYVNFVVKPAYEVLGMLLPEVEKKVLPLVVKNLGHWELEKEKLQEQPEKLIRAVGVRLTNT